jgi:hypothetical protein
MINKNIPCIMTERKWMRAAKAWRCFFELPPDSMVLATALTALIEQQIRLVINDIDINPAFIVDVASKGKRFYLVAETVSETQMGFGTSLTPLTGERVIISVLPTEEAVTEPEPQPKPRGNIQDHVIKGLHTVFFKQQLFQQFIHTATSKATDTPELCKEAFKSLYGVTSCTELNQEQWNYLKSKYDAYAQQGQGLTRVG